MSETAMKKMFTQFLKRGNLVPEGSSVLMAVSGGVDSVVMAHLFRRISEQFDLDLKIAHFNHNLRGAESDEDEAFVKGLAESWKLPFLSDRWDSPAETNLEAEARKARYTFLEKSRRELESDLIATAHHADDQAETILMRLVEGAGYRGLRGMPEKSGRIVRPLLHFTKQELQDYASANSLRFMVDSSNSDLKFDRNRIRKKIIPRIKDLNPSFATTVRRTVSSLNDVSALLDREVSALYSGSVSLTAEGYFQIDEEFLGETPLFLKKELIRSIAEGDDSPWRGAVWDRLDSFLQSAAVGDILDLPRHFRLLRDRGRFLLKQDQIEDIPDSIAFESSSPKALEVGGFRFSIDHSDLPPLFSDDFSSELVDSSLLGRSLNLRKWRAGDWMVPLGMDGRKKVSDILIDEQVNRFEKESQFVLTSRDEIVWLCGRRLDDRYKVTGETSSLARLNWRRMAK